MKKRAGTLSLYLRPWELKIIVKALALYAPDSSEAAEYPEEFWIFKRKLDSELHAVEFMDAIQKPDDLGLLGPMPKIEGPND